MDPGPNLTESTVHSVPSRFRPERSDSPVAQSRSRPHRHDKAQGFPPVALVQHQPLDIHVELNGLLQCRWRTRASQISIASE